jgi:hypothetical protein
MNAVIQLADLFDKAEKRQRNEREEFSALDQQGRLLLYFKRYRHINPISSWSRLGIYRLADVVHKLRKKGYRIDTVDTAAKNCFGEPVEFATYVYFPKEDGHATLPD